MPSFRNEVKLISMIQINLFYLTILNMQRYAYQNKREHRIYTCKVKFERQNETSRIRLTYTQLSCYSKIPTNVILLIVFLTAFEMFHPIVYNK